MHSLHTTSRAKCANLRSHSRASRFGRRPPPLSLAASPSPAPKRDGFPKLPNDPSPVFEHCTPPLPPTTRTKSPLPPRTQPLPVTSCPSKTLTPLRVASNSPRLRVEGTLSTLPPNSPRLRVEEILPRLTPRFSTQYSQKLIRHILDFPVPAAPPSARRVRA